MQVAKQDNDYYIKLDEVEARQLKGLVDWSGTHVSWVSLAARTSNGRPAFYANLTTLLRNCLPVLPPSRPRPQRLVIPITITNEVESL